AAVAVGISAGGDDEIFRHAAATLPSHGEFPTFPNSVLAPRCFLRRQKNFIGVGIFDRSPRRKTAHVDVAAVWREWTCDKSLLARNRRPVGKIFAFPRRSFACASRVLFVRWFDRAFLRGRLRVRVARRSRVGSSLLASASAAAMLCRFLLRFGKCLAQGADKLVPRTLLLRFRRRTEGAEQ